MEYCKITINLFLRKFNAKLGSNRFQPIKTRHQLILNCFVQVLNENYVEAFGYSIPVCESTLYACQHINKLTHMNNTNTKQHFVQLHYATGN